MADSTVIAGSLIYSHIIPPLMAFFGIILICSGIMDRKTKYTIVGIALFMLAGLLPFLILPFILGV